MGGVFVWVLVSVTAISHHGHAQLVKSYQSTFSRQDTCVAVMEEMNRASDDYSWYCEKHIVE